MKNFRNEKLLSHFFAILPHFSLIETQKEHLPSDFCPPPSLVLAVPVPDVPFAHLPFILYLFPKENIGCISEKSKYIWFFV
jgi:hypothetical protein